MRNYITGLAGLAFVAFLTAASCNQNSGGVTPAPPVVTDQSDCAAACDNLRHLGCDEGNPIDMGTKCKVNSDCKDVNGNTDAKQSCSALGTCMVSCVNFCIDTENQGVWLDPTCVKNISNCNQINSCPTPKPKPAAAAPACKGEGGVCQVPRQAQ